MFSARTLTRIQTCANAHTFTRTHSHASTAGRPFEHTSAHMPTCAFAGPHIAINLLGLQDLNFGEAIAETPAAIVEILFAVGFGLSLIGLCSYHTKLVMKNATTNEEVCARVRPMTCYGGGRPLLVYPHTSNCLHAPSRSPSWTASWLSTTPVHFTTQ